MRNIFSKITLAAYFLLALAFTFSCHGGGGDDNEVLVSSSSETTVTPSSSDGSSSSVNIFVSDTSGTFNDSRDGKTYNWVKIGTQIWMAENLNYYKELLGKCYDNKDSNCETYGRLYEWDDAIRLCPDGWHLPTQAEWNTLASAVGNDASKKLKSTSSDWRDGAGTDDYGFKGLPGGELDGEFKNINIAGVWWTSAYFLGTYAVLRYMDANNFEESHSQQTNLHSVRCVKGYSSSSSIIYGEITDKRDNKKYATVKIGTQTWMAQNLNYAGANSQIGLCYNNKTENCNKYGRLYDWATAMNVSEDYNTQQLNAPPGQHQGICPDSWHLPTISEWNALISFVDGNAGRRLKARSSEWGNDYGTDVYSFGALPSGGLDGEFKNINKTSEWWTPSDFQGNRAVLKHMDAGNEVGESNSLKTSHYSIRCVED
jgi:uncharacterized protein (TIGR02145 family)